MASIDWNPETFTSRDLAGQTCPECGEDLTVEAFVGKVGRFDGFEMTEYEENGETLITWVNCSECEKTWLDRTLVAAAQAEAIWHAEHPAPPKDEAQSGTLDPVRIYPAPSW